MLCTQSTPVHFADSGLFRNTQLQSLHHVHWWHEVVGLVNKVIIQQFRRAAATNAEPTTCLWTYLQLKRCLLTQHKFYSQKSPAASRLSVNREQSTFYTHHPLHIIHRDYQENPEQLRHFLVWKLHPFVSQIPAVDSV